MIPPKLNPQPIDDVARSGIPVMLFWGDGIYETLGFFRNGRWENNEGITCGTTPVGYRPLAVPIPGPPPKDGEWYFCWLTNGIKTVIRWSSAMIGYLNNRDDPVPEVDILFHLPQIILPKETQPITPLIDISKATDKELLAELLRRNS